jgi:hypothetical protein
MDKVIFRKENNGSICAIFPYILADRHNITIWDDVSGHGACSFSYATMHSKPASPDEYARSKSILENVYGYKLEVIKRMPSYKSFLRYAKTACGIFLKDLV